MRPLKKLTFDAFRDELATTFAQIADPRDPRRITWEMPAVLMSAFAMLFFQHPSLLEYQRRMQQADGTVESGAGLSGRGDSVGYADAGDFGRRADRALTAGVAPDL